MFTHYTLDILVNVSFFSVLLYALKLRSGSASLSHDTKTIAICYAVFAALMMGLYYIPFNSGGGDRELYALNFMSYANHMSDWESAISNNEWLFQCYMCACSFLNNPVLWLILTAFIYVFNNYYAVKRLGGQNVFLLLLMLCASFGFVGYGTNTIRSGLALSFVLIGITYYDSLWKCLLFFFLAFNIHHSAVIPMAAFLLAKYYTRPRVYYYFWFLCVGLSLVSGSFFETLFNAWGSEFDARTSYLVTTDTHYNVGFRLDFVLFSCLPIFMGHFYQFRLKYEDRFYSILHSTYIIANAFWVLVIRSNFSDRFAYLSWFLYALVMMYPLVQNPDHFNNVRRKLFWTMLIVAGFQYCLYLRG